MTPAEYLDAAKQRLSLSSDYELAKRMGEERSHVAAMRQGKRAVPVHLAYWLAITLELDPAEVVADLEAQREKNPKRAEFWRSFLLRARSIAAAILCTLALISSVGVGSEPGAAGGRIRRRLCLV